MSELYYHHMYKHSTDFVKYVKLSNKVLLCIISILQYNIPLSTGYTLSLIHNKACII